MSQDTSSKELVENLLQTSRLLFATQVARNGAKPIVVCLGEVEQHDYNLTCSGILKEKICDLLEAELQETYDTIKADLGDA